MQSDNENRAAGALILAEIEVFDRSKLYFDKEIRPEIWREILGYLETWKDANGLAGEAESETYYYFCPPAWSLGDLGHLAWIEFIHDVEEGSYDIADLCGVGTGRVGFRFKFESLQFGGRKNWLALTKQAKFTDYVERLSAAGFVSDKIGELFMQVIIPPSDVSAAWTSADWETAFQPIADALATIKANLPLLEEFVDWARSSSVQT